MHRDTRKIVLGSAVGVAAAAAAGYGLLVRPWHLRWGATKEESTRPMPLDDVIQHPNYVTTRAITIKARPDQIWPWLVQMGELPRAGFYSYAWIERAMGMSVINSDRILPELQQLNVGDILDKTGNVVVRAIDPPHSIVLGPPEGIPDGDATWAIVLEPISDTETRLISRVRAHFGHTFRAAVLYALVDPGQFLMERRWFLGIKERAERGAIEH